MPLCVSVPTSCGPMNLTPVIIALSGSLYAHASLNEVYRVLISLDPHCGNLKHVAPSCHRTFPFELHDGNATGLHHRGSSLPRRISTPVAPSFLHARVLLTVRGPGSRHPLRVVLRGHMPRVVIVALLLWLPNGFGPLASCLALKIPRAYTSTISSSKSPSSAGVATTDTMPGPGGSQARNRSTSNAFGALSCASFGGVSTCPRLRGAIA